MSFFKWLVGGNQNEDGEDAIVEMCRPFWDKVDEMLSKKDDDDKDDGKRYFCGRCGCMMPISHFPH